MFSEKKKNKQINNQRRRIVQKYCCNFTKESDKIKTKCQKRWITLWPRISHNIIDPINEIWTSKVSVSVNVIALSCSILTRFPWMNHRLTVFMATRLKTRYSFILNSKPHSCCDLARWMGQKSSTSYIIYSGDLQPYWYSQVYLHPNKK